MLMDTLMHRSLFFSKSLYEKKVTARDRQDFQDQIIDDHNDPAAMFDFQDCWNNHVTSRVQRQLPVAYGLRLVAQGHARSSSAGESGSRSSGLLQSLFDAEPSLSSEVARRNNSGEPAGKCLCYMHHKCAHFDILSALLLNYVHLFDIGVHILSFCVLLCIMSVHILSF
jgi:hypothetical protein